MDKENLDRYQTMLKDLLAELQDDLDANPDDASTVELDTSIGRLARMDAMQSQQMALELKRRTEQRIQRIERALTLISIGTYGTCGKCHEPISQERLDYQPDAVMCVRCATG
jgi:DnaK suppressor protein